jgi:hypothetical protein
MMRPGIGTLRRRGRIMMRPYAGNTTTRQGAAPGTRGRIMMRPYRIWGKPRLTPRCFGSGQRDVMTLPRV